MSFWKNNLKILKPRTSEQIYPYKKWEFSQNSKNKIYNLISASRPIYKEYNIQPRRYKNRYVNIHVYQLEI